MHWVRSASIRSNGLACADRLRPTPLRSVLQVPLSRDKCPGPPGIIWFLMCWAPVPRGRWPHGQRAPPDRHRRQRRGRRRRRAGHVARTGRAGAQPPSWSWSARSERHVPGRPGYRQTCRGERAAIGTGPRQSCGQVTRAWITSPAPDYRYLPRHTGHLPRAHGTPSHAFFKARPTAPRAVSILRKCASTTTGGRTSISKATPCTRTELFSPPRQTPRSA
jgi:hypothetical protein